MFGLYTRDQNMAGKWPNNERIFFRFSRVSAPGTWPEGQMTHHHCKYHLQQTAHSNPVLLIGLSLIILFNLN